MPWSVTTSHWTSVECQTKYSPLHSMNLSSWDRLLSFLTFFSSYLNLHLCVQRRMVDFRNCHPFSKILLFLYHLWHLCVHWWALPLQSCLRMQEVSSSLYGFRRQLWTSRWHFSGSSSMPDHLYVFIFRHIFKENERVQDATVSAE